jgi:hypothetical protein
LHSFIKQIVYNIAKPFPPQHVRYFYDKAIAPLKLMCENGLFKTSINRIPGGIRLAPFSLKEEAMADNKEIRGPQDGKFVNLSEDYEVRYWTNRFSCSEEELRSVSA